MGRSEGAAPGRVTTYAVVVLPEAEAEANGAFRWYLERSPMAADAFRAEVIAAIDRLASTAHTWAPDQDGVRHYILIRFPYTLHYELENQTVTILAIAHQRRRPGYWQDR